MSYKVKFIMQVIGGDHSAGPGDVWLKHEMELPFPPTDIYGYSDGKWYTDNARWEERKNNRPPADIEWRNDLQRFDFYVADDRTVWYDESLRSMEPGEKKDKAYADMAMKIANEYIDDYGWELDDRHVS